MKLNRIRRKWRIRKIRQKWNHSLSFLGHVITLRNHFDTWLHSISSFQYPIVNMLVLWKLRAWANQVAKSLTSHLMLFFVDISLLINERNFKIIFSLHWMIACRDAIALTQDFQTADRTLLCTSNAGDHQNGRLLFYTPHQWFAVLSTFYNWSLLFTLSLCFHKIYIFSILLLPSKHLPQIAKIIFYLQYFSDRESISFWWNLLSSTDQL